MNGRLDPLPQGMPLSPPPSPGTPHPHTPSPAHTPAVLGPAPHTNVQKTPSHTYHLWVWSDHTHYQKRPVRTYIIGEYNRSPEARECHVLSVLFFNIITFPYLGAEILVLFFLYFTGPTLFYFARVKLIAFSLQLVTYFFRH